MSINNQKILDRFTRIDEILIESLQENTRILTQLENTNRLLYALLQKPALLQAAQGSNVQGDLRAISQSSTNLAYDEFIKTLSRPSYTTKKIELKNKQGTSFTVLDIEGSGAISEILFRTEFGAVGDANQVFNIQISADGVVLYDNSYDEYVDKSDYQVDMTAFADASYNVVVFSAIFFSNRCSIRVSGSTATFYDITAKIIERL